MLGVFKTTVPKSVSSATSGVLSPETMSIALPCRFISRDPPKRVETEFEPALAVAISCQPSPLKSPTATDCGSVPVTTSVVPLKPPCPSPKRMETELEL